MSKPESFGNESQPTACAPSAFVATARAVLQGFDFKHLVWTLLMAVSMILFFVAFTSPSMCASRFGVRLYVQSCWMHLSLGGEMFFYQCGARVRGCVAGIVHACVCAPRPVSARLCVCACVPVCLCASVSVCLGLSVSLRASTHAYLVAVLVSSFQQLVCCVLVH